MRTKTRRRAAPRVGIRVRTPIRFGFGPRKKKKGLTTRITPRGTGSTFSSYGTRARKMTFRRRVANMSPEQYKLNTQGIRVTCPYSKQGSLQTYAFTYADLDTTSNNVPGYNDTTKVLMKGMKKTVHMTNMAKSNVFIDIVEFTYRRTTTANFGHLWNAGLADQVAGVDSATYGVTPFMSTALTQFIKINKIFTIELGAGRSHRHVSNYRMNKEFSRQQLAETATAGGNAYMAGWTKGCVYILRGEPLNDQTTKTTVVPSSCAVDFVITEELRMYYGNPTNTTMEFSSSLATTGVTEWLMDDAQGEPEAQAVA